MRLLASGHLFLADPPVSATHNAAERGLVHVVTKGKFSGEPKNFCAPPARLHWSLSSAGGASNAATSSISTACSYSSAHQCTLTGQ